MTKERIIQDLMNEYLECVFRSASPDDPSRDDEYLEGVLDGRARGMLYAIQLLKKNESDPKSQPKHFTEGITLSQLYLVNTNWASNSLLRITLNKTELDAMTAHKALIRYGHLNVSSFVENHVYINDVKDK